MIIREFREEFVHLGSNWFAGINHLHRSPTTTDRSYIFHISPIFPFSDKTSDRGLHLAKEYGVCINVLYISQGWELG